MKLVRDLRELTRHDLPLAGGKASTLGDMLRAGIPIPPGFVVLSPAFDSFVAEAGLNARLSAYREAVLAQQVEAANALSAEIRDEVMRTAIPNELSTAISSHMKALGARSVAVRSSAAAEDGTHATWAGQLDSFLNTDERTLLANITKCWASLLGPKANFYRLHKDPHPSTTMGVIVQEMVESEVSGVAFSAHPVTRDRSIVLVEAGFGLGEAVVSGRITPDSYTVAKRTLGIVARDVAYQHCLAQSAGAGGIEWQDFDQARGEMQKLSDSAIRELAEWVIAIEEHWGYPVDVEWALAGNRFYTLQSRAVIFAD